MGIIRKIMNSEVLTEKPPVLLDIGASEGVHARWKPIARYCICIAFDPDSREFSDSGLRKYFKQLHTFPCAVSAEQSEEVKFFLTRSPYCSSTLEPDLEALRPWSFSRLFEFDRTGSVKSRTLKQVLSDVDIDRIDWFKADSQGTDLRLFRSLGEDIISRVIAAEFEPGIIDAYKGEDKLFSVLDFMNKNGFWLSDMNVKGSQRISADALESLFPAAVVRKLAMFSHKTSPGWAELLYFNTFNGSLSKREYLLGWLFATLQEQHGFAYLLAKAGTEKWTDPLFSELFRRSRKTVRHRIISLKLLPYIIRKLGQVKNRILG
jgi:FkbM family methyltransferase